MAHARGRAAARVAAALLAHAVLAFASVDAIAGASVAVAPSATVASTAIVALQLAFSAAISAQLFAAAVASVKKFPTETLNTAFAKLNPDVQARVQTLLQ